MVQEAKAQIMSKTRVAIYSIRLRYVYVTKNLFFLHPLKHEPLGFKPHEPADTDDLLLGTGLAARWR